MRTRVALYVVLGIVLFPLLLALTAPATWVGWGLVRLSEGRVQLHEVDGYVWAGEGTLVVNPGFQPPVALGRFHWDVNPWPLFQGRLSVQVQGGDAATRVQGHIELARTELAAHDLLASLPAELVSALYAPATLVGPGGQVRFSSESLRLRDRDIRGQAIVAWDGAATRFSPVRPLGDYQLRLEGRGSRADLRLETTAGTLNLSGAGQWDLQSGTARFDGVAMAAARATELEPLLRLFGRDQGGGRRTFALETHTAPAGLPW